MGNMGAKPKQPPAMKTEEDLIHMLLSDVFHITNES